MWERNEEIFYLNYSATLDNHLPMLNDRCMNNGIVLDQHANPNVLARKWIQYHEHYATHYTRLSGSV